MKKTVEIVGIEKRSGISKKTNEPYEFYILHGIYDNANVDGTCTWSGIVPATYAVRTKVHDLVVIESHFIAGKEIIDSFLLPAWQ